MLDLVENPEDRFSRVAAHMSFVMGNPAFCMCKNKDISAVQRLPINKLYNDKNCL